MPTRAARKIRKRSISTVADWRTAGSSLAGPLVVVARFAALQCLLVGRNSLQPHLIHAWAECEKAFNERR